jgi:SAM-dependent methyltransferase
MQQLNACPICQHSNLMPAFDVKDYTVSHETFHLVKCASCHFLFTNPRPDKTEIGAYYKSEDYISHTNSKSGLINTLYQWARKRAINGKLRLLEEVCEGPRTLLDYGCGTGEFLSAAVSRGWTGAGLEPDSGAREQARNNYRLNVEDPDALKRLPDGQFGAITLWHVLEHVHDLQETLAELKRCLASNGSLIIAVPNAEALEAVHYGTHWAAYDVPRHLYHFTQDSMIRLTQQHGLRCVTINGLFFDPYYISLLSERYQHGGFRPFQAAYRGLQTTLRSRRRLNFNSSLLYVFKHQA